MKPTLLQQAKGPFFHEFEALDEESRLRIMKASLADLIATAKKTEFYRERLAGVNVDDEHPLKDLPLLTSQDLRENVPPGGTGLLTRTPDFCSVFQSGGTTGVPKTSIFSYEEMELINQGNARGFYAVGLEQSDRVANLWAVGGLYMTFVHMNRVLMEYGCMSFPFSNQTPFEFVHSVAKLFDINVFTGITSVVLNCLRDSFQKDPGALKIEKIYFGGEHIYDTDRKEMQEKFGVQVIQAPGYGTIDSWYLGYQCSHCPNGVFHAFDDMCLLEIVDEDENKHCAKGQTGMLYATPYHRRLTPVIRYRVGDKARWLKESCACGRTTPLFELLGRGDDVLRIGYDSVDYVFIQGLVSRVKGASGRVQMEKRRREGRDELIVRIETARSKNDYPEMTAELTEIFLKERPSFSEFLKKGTIWPLVIEWLGENELPQNKRTGKLIRVIDSL